MHVRPSGEKVRSPYILRRTRHFGKDGEANTLVRGFSESDDRLGFVDVDGPMLGWDEKPRKDLLVADGLSNADIAERLGISDKTVRNHVSHMFDKLGVWTRAQAIVFARERGFARSR